MCMLYGRLGLCRWYCGAVETGTVSVHVNRILRGRRSPTEEDRNAPNTPPADPSAHPGQTEVALTHRPWASVAFLPRCSQVVSNRKASVFNGDTRSRHRLQDVKKKQQQKNNPTSVLHVTRTLLPMEQAHVYTQPIASVWYRLLFISI